MTITQTLCQEFQTAPWQIDAVIRLLDEGCTLPFIRVTARNSTGRWMTRSCVKSANG